MNEDFARKMQAVRDGPLGRLCRHPVFAPVALFLLSGFLLSQICSWNDIYEEDEQAKAAQILALGRPGALRHFSEAPDYYRKDLFSAYFIAATVFQKVTALRAAPALNLFSVLCGVVFFTVTPVFLRRVFALPLWLGWLVLFSAPILVISFCYGNEASFALTAAALAAFALSFDRLGARIAGAIFYTAAVYGRTDYLLLGPALGLLCVVRPGPAIDRPKTLRHLLVFFGTALVLGVGYLALVIRKIPVAQFWDYSPSLKLMLAFLWYSPNPVNVLFALLGAGVCLARREKKYWLLLPVLLQALPSLPYLSSPKYILPAIVVVSIFAGAGMQALLRRSRLAWVALVAAPWFISVTPFGVFGPARAPYYYLPTDDGPVPTGGYFTFYGKVKQAFYQNRYQSDYAQMDQAMQKLNEAPERRDLVGYFTVQTLRLWAATNKRWDIPVDRMPLWDSHWNAYPAAVEEKREKFMLKTGYLYLSKEREPAARAKYEDHFRTGAVISAAPGTDPFPSVIQFGVGAPPGADAALGKRILFISEYYGGQQAVHQESFIPDLAGISWLPAAHYAGQEDKMPKPIYADSEWVCFDKEMVGAIYYSMRFPRSYARFR